MTRLSILSVLYLRKGTVWVFWGWCLAFSGSRLLGTFTTYSYLCLIYYLDQYILFGPRSMGHFCLPCRTKVSSECMSIVLSACTVSKAKGSHRSHYVEVWLELGKFSASTMPQNGLMADCKWKQLLYQLLFWWLFNYWRIVLIQTDSRMLVLCNCH